MTVKVLHIFGIMNRGGAELRTLSTTTWMQERDVHYDFVALSGQKGVLDEQIIEHGGKVHYCKLGPSFIANFVKLLRSEKYDIVHSHVSLVSGLINFIAWCCGVKTRIAHFRSTRDVEYPSLVRKFRDAILRQLTIQFSQKIVGVCKASLDAFFPKQWQKSDKFCVIYNGFPTVSLRPQADFWCQHIPNYHGQSIIASVARMDEPKNHPLIAQVFAKFCQINQDAELVLIGKEDTKIKAAMEAIFNQQGASERVHYLSEQSNVMPFLINANLMFFPSKWEGLPGAVIESASAGTPVLGSDIPGIAEISERISSVHTMSLQEGTLQWAEKLDSMLSTKVEREQEQEKFNQSDFQFNLNVEQLYALYALSL